jgi:hypothetical protein
MLKSSSIFKRNGAHLVEKKDVGKKKGMFTEGISIHLNGSFDYIFSLKKSIWINFILKC